MLHCEIVREINNARLKSGLTFEEIAKEIGKSKEWTAALLYRQATATKEEALKLKELLNLSDKAFEALQRSPIRGGISPDIPSDPLVYRFYEITKIYGPAIKALINEMFGDGIMSAIDFKFEIKKKETENGDRVIVIFDGKFLPYKKW